MINKEIFAQRLIKLREQHNITQQALAADLYISRQSLSLYEKAERTVNIDILVKVAQRFNVSTDYLLGLSDIQNTNTDFDITEQELYEIIEQTIGLNAYTSERLRRFYCNIKEFTSVINELFAQDELILDLMLHITELASNSYIFSKFQDDIDVQMFYGGQANSDRYAMHALLEKMLDAFDYRCSYNIALAPYAEKKIKEAFDNAKHNPKKE